MIGIEFRFPAGAYHATPWGRHVNEAEVEWPPSPWRLLRALIAAWHRYGLADRHSEALLRETVHQLASSLPVYALPPAVHAHTRHYMPTGDKPTLVFDGFLRFGRDAVLGVYWPQVELPDAARWLLQDAVASMSYLGRAESWVAAEVVTQACCEINCGPLGTDLALFSGASPPETEMEYVPLLAPEPPAHFQPPPPPAGKRGGRKQGAGHGAPRDIYEALLVDTNQLQEEKRNLPLGARWVHYVRKPLPESAQWPEPASGSSPGAPAAGGSSYAPALAVDAWREAEAARIRHTALRGINAARLALTSRVMPRLVDALDVAEVVHLALLKHCGENAPLLVSGREADGSVSVRGHEHLFILPEDADMDGRLDHVLLYARVSFPETVIRAIQSLQELGTPDWWPGPARRWRVYLEGFFHVPNAGAAGGDRPWSTWSAGLAASNLLGPARRWVSATPYLHPWHRKRNGRFDAMEQMLKELQLRGFPAPSRIKELPVREVRGARLFPQRFRRVRYAKRQHIPGVRGTFFEIEFPEPVQGPLAFGANCHFGMGLYIPELDVSNLAWPASREQEAGDA
ncbi:hypothetical protein GCM10010885_11480 [Alicyclobacillus cellulosilyticus]|uniref:CRISPR-associated protein Csb2 n=1 Tax=Alicyclobacillus cellulosilyticus TaxID=1003997 RepID=A0A917K8K6_9BACL|nr:type I-U CRISPR-associated protein Csb2 [Alicyclobacillus cellulosilyticus]GGJ03953.1 hypothetical protein GCM10010885_11480 [Alicyclobacillus cellulosilyticus]